MKKWSEEIFVEVTKRGYSEVYERVTAVMNEIGRAASNARPGMHGYVALLTTPTDAEVKLILAWLANMTSEAAQLSGLAHFWTRPLDEPSTPELGEELVPLPRMFAANIQQGNGRVNARSTIIGTVDDNAVRTIVEHEDSQLAVGRQNILIIDASRLIGGFRAWRSRVESLLSAPNTLRCSQVVLLGSSLVQEGIQWKGCRILNPHASQQVPMECDEVFNRLFTLEK